MSHTALVCDLSSALESLLVHGLPSDEVVPRRDALRRRLPLASRRWSPAELDVLPDLLAMRLVTDAVLFGWRAARHPDNAYLRGWEDPGVALARYLEARAARAFRASARRVRRRLADRDP